MAMILDILGSIWWLIVAIGVLVTFHEYGHFAVARRLGVKVLRFSVGFGPALWSRTGRDGVEYVVAAIPLGGYVKMLDEREGDVAAEDCAQAFNRQSVWARIAIAAAGPVFNLVFAVLALWVMFMIGVMTLKPIVGEVEGIAAQAGLRQGDQIVAVGGEGTQSWTEVILAVMGPTLDQQSVPVSVKTKDGATRELRLPLEQAPGEFEEDQLLDVLGINAGRPQVEMVVGGVQESSAAAAAGLQKGDKILQVDAQPVETWQALKSAVQAAGESDEALTLGLLRDGKRITVNLEPRWTKTGSGEGQYLMGITGQPPSQEEIDAYFATRRYGPVAAFGQALVKTGDLTGATLGFLGRMLTGQMSTDNLSGPITIARVAGNAAELGLSKFLYFLGLLSLSLAILNLLPIPVLDGGHLLYYLIELVKGSPLSESAQEAGQYVGLALLAGLMGLAFYNDIMRLIAS